MHANNERVLDLYALVVSLKDRKGVTITNAITVTITFKRF